MRRCPRGSGGIFLWRISGVRRASRRRCFPRPWTKGASGAGETAERSGAGSTVYAHGQWTCSRLQRANGVDAEHALIVAHKITDTAGDNSLLLPMAEAALEALGHPESLHVVADAGYSNGEQAEACEAQGIVPHVPVTRAVNNQGDGTLFDRNEFHYDEKTDTFRCPANQTLTRKQLSRKDRAVYYAAKPEVCGACALKMRCTNRWQRLVSRHLHEDAFQRMQQRATPEMMRLRRSTVEHPFASLKYHIFGHPRFLLRGLKGAQTEISLATMVYNLKRMLNVSGGSLRAALVS